MKKTQKPKLISYLQTFLDFQKVVKLLLTCLVCNLSSSYAHCLHTHFLGYTTVKALRCHDGYYYEQQIVQVS